VPDIRETLLLDDFVRANESPLYGPDPFPAPATWAATGGSFGSGLDLITNRVTHPPAGVGGSSLWIADGTIDGDFEVWGLTHGGGANGIAWALEALRPGTQTGYRLRQEVSSSGGSMRIYRVSAGSTSALATVSGGPPTGGSHLLLFKRVGALLQGWYSNDTSGLTGWTKHVETSHSEFVTGIALGLGIRDNSGFNLLSWAGGTSPGGGFGGGPPIPPEPPTPFLPQQMRRRLRRSTGVVTP
jgi:hypothetical protein